LERNEFIYVLKELGITLTAPEMDRLFRHFDANQDNQISYGEFTAMIRPPWVEGRQQVVKEVFQALVGPDADSIALPTLLTKYNPEVHAEVQNGKTTPNEVLNRVAQLWRQYSVTALTLEHFLKFYGGVSSSFESDSEFAAFVRSSWVL
jgi:EF hand